MIRAKKNLGQNFLTDRRVAAQIIDSVSLSTNDVIIEIGPGKGALTAMLCKQSGHVVAVEIDARLAEELGRSLKAENVTIVTADALSLNWAELIEGSKAKIDATLRDKNDRGRVRIVANLPYYISTPIIEKLLSCAGLIFDMTLMLQKEVADRIAAEPCGKEYGYLSVMVQYYCAATKLFEVPPSAFTPEPKVDSAVIRLRVREQPAVKVADERRFFSLVRACFAQRRKTILNNLKVAAASQSFAADVGSALEAASVASQRRAETLSLAEFAGLFEALYVA
ncbi:MAG TPA: 16S rRNA (adenine(1518)-N(6)/adenine(1519)-N(6))-dimethyltransferase RsmA [Blastocatellia bacterium]|nr:16S rRNA (adenine(1518)-N(6)/adenine(1519)-N(6))-dimethyltransferase RsmA [Blastocatellia bacterium]